MSHPASKPPLPVHRTLRKFGHDLQNARKRRRIPAAILAERAGISRMTLFKIEKGDPSVSFGGYAGALFALGLIDRLGDLADNRHDVTGLGLDEEQLPQRIRISTKKTEKKDGP